MQLPAFGFKWQLLAGLLLALGVAACTPGPGQTPTSLPPAETTATVLAATGQAQVEAIAVATATALKLTASAPQTLTAPSPNPGLGQALSTATLGVCRPEATDCGSTATPTTPMAPTTGAPTTGGTPTPVPAISTPTLPSTDAPGTAVQPTDSSAQPSATSTLSAMDCYNKPCVTNLASPDGQHHWPETCTYLGIDWDCFITFPSGQTTTHFMWPILWSADGQYLLVAQGGSHDSSPGGYEIWNMPTATQTATLTGDVIWEGWAPTDHTLGYVQNLSYPNREFRVLDAATGQSTATRQCPDWATRQVKINAYFDWRQFCDNWTPPPGEPLILSFTVDPTAVVPGQAITLAWTSANATVAELQAYSASSAPGTPTPLPPNGSLVLTVGKDEKLSYTLNLIVRDDAGKTDQGSQSVSLLCADTFFFSTSNVPRNGGCPYRPPARVAAAEQTFEKGRMLWLAPIPADNTASGIAQPAAIYVLYNAGVTGPWGTWEQYADPWSTGEPESDPTLQPPAGLSQPLRGFGKLWRETPGRRETLGWATGPEQGYTDGDYQIQWRYGNPAGDIYLRAANQAILYLQLDGYWWTQ